MVQEMWHIYKLEIIIVILVSVIISTVIGARKGNPISGFIVGLIFGPLGILLALVSGDKNRVPCKYCAEKILRKASICPFCNKEQ